MRPVDDSSGDGERGATSRGRVAGGGGADEIDDSWEHATELEGDGEEGSNSRVLLTAGGAGRAVHRGENPP